MVQIVDLQEAETQLSSLVDRAASGEEIVISKNGQPVAKLVAVPQPKKRRRQPSNALQITYMADDFDGPLPPELLKRRDLFCCCDDKNRSFGRGRLQGASSGMTESWPTR